MIYSEASHIGKVRKNNEDYCHGEVIETSDGKIGLFALADGMGGHKKGETASVMAVDGVIEFIKYQLIKKDYTDIENIENILKESYKYVNSKIYTKSQENSEYRGMGTTLVVAINHNKKLYIANVGDSRCYIYRNDILKKITKDHSVIEDLLRSGVITEKEAKTHPSRNQITRAIGTDSKVMVDIYIVELKKYDKILLSSDGLTGFVEHDIIKEIMKNNDVEVDIISNDLINKANEISGKDNITVIVIEEE